MSVGSVSPLLPTRPSRRHTPTSLLLSRVGANRIVLFDSDWNPATDDQAKSHPIPPVPPRPVLGTFFNRDEALSSHQSVCTLL